MWGGITQKSGCPERRAQPLRTLKPLVDRVPEGVRVDSCVAIEAGIPLRAEGCLGGSREGRGSRAGICACGLREGSKIEGSEERLAGSRLECRSSEIEEETDFRGSGWMGLDDDTDGAGEEVNPG